MSFFNLEALKGKPTKSIKIMAKNFQKICFWDKKIEKKKKKKKNKQNLQLIWTYENMVKS
jgi:hypothetical protein